MTDGPYVCSSVKYTFMYNVGWSGKKVSVPWGGHFEPSQKSLWALPNRQQTSAKSECQIRVKQVKIRGSLAYLSLPVIVAFTFYVYNFIHKLDYPLQHYMN